MVPGFRPIAIKRDPTVEAQYAAVEEAAAAGKRPQSGMMKRLHAALQMIKQDGQWGEVVKPEMIPRYFREKYGATNLYCVDLSGSVRCFYTVENKAILFLDIVDHEEYDKWFPPKGRRRRR